MKNYLCIILVFILIGCYRTDTSAPAKNLIVKVDKLKHYKSYVFINDSISFSYVYFKKSPEFIPDVDILSNFLKVGDTIFTNEHPKDSILLRKNGEDIMFYTWPMNLSKQE